MVLVQILEHGSHDEATLNMILKSLEFFSDLTDVDYESLLWLHDQISSQKLTYSQDVSSKIIKLLCKI